MSSLRVSLDLLPLLRPLLVRVLLEELLPLLVRALVEELLPSLLLLPLRPLLRLLMEELLHPLRPLLRVLMEELLPSLRSLLRLLMEELLPPPPPPPAAAAPLPVGDATPAAGDSEEPEPVPPRPVILPAMVVNCIKDGGTVPSVHFGSVQPSLMYGGSYMELGAELSPTEALQQGSYVPGPSTPPRTRARFSSSRRRRSRSPSPEPSGPTPAEQQASWAGVAWTAPPEKPEDTEQHKAAFRAYLVESCVEIAEQLWVEKSFHFRIDYDDLKRKNKALAYYIANNLKKFQSTLKSIVKRFLLHRFGLKRENGQPGLQAMHATIESLTVLSFTGIPNRINSLEDFISQNKTELGYLFKDHPDCRHLVAVIKPAMRRVTQKMVGYVTSAHREGKTWNGEWNLEDWEVLDDSTVRMTKRPRELPGGQMHPLDLEAIPEEVRQMQRLDLAAISQKVIPKLSHTETGKYPALFTNLSKELLTKGTEEMSNKAFYGWFYTWLKYHPALMSSKARAGLLYGFYHSAVRLNYNMRQSLQVIFNDRTLGEWTAFVYSDWMSIPEVQWRVFWHNNYPALKIASNPEAWNLPYRSTLGGPLDFIRQILEHSNRHTFWCKFQTMISSTEPELLAADCYEAFLPEFTKLLFQHGLMQFELHDNWDFYTQSSGYDGM